MSLPLAALLATPSPSPSPSSIDPSDLGATASTYASFAEIMTGFSFAALAIYLAYESPKGKRGTGKSDDNAGGHGRDPRNTKSDGKQKLPLQVGAEHPIRRTEVAATLFYGMASLAISSFLYASLTTQVETVSKAAAVLLLYGVVFGPSVLAFFYALTLMTYQNPDTKGAAKAAYLVVVIVGPLVVLRFLAGAAQGAWNLRCSSSGSCAPENWSPPLIVAIAALILLLGISISVSEKRVFEEWPKLRWLCNWLCVRPVLPAFVIFVFSATVTVAGMLATEPISYVPPAYFIWVSLAAGFILLVCFALACGCVVGPRLDKPAPRFRGKYLSLTTFKCNGTDLASPVRFVTDEGKIFIVTDCAGSFKVEQIRLNPAVTVADCAASGRLRSSGVSARADVLSDDETQNLKRLMARKYRFERFRTRVLQVISRRHREEEQKIAVLVTLSS